MAKFLRASMMSKIFMDLPHSISSSLETLALSWHQWQKRLRLHPLNGPLKLIPPLKRSITKAQVLALSYFDKVFDIECDAFNVSIGEVLT